MIVYETINDLRSATAPSTPEVVYVRGHTFAGDGGGGIFMWRIDGSFTNATYTDGSGTHTNPYYYDNNGIIIWIGALGASDPTDNSGRWIRQYEGYINVHYFGALGYSSNDTQAIQTAIDFAYNNNVIPIALLKGSTVYFPSGSYLSNEIIVRTGISILGDSILTTSISSSIPTDSFYTKGTGYLFNMDAGPVQIAISNILVSGRNTDKGAFNFKAKPKSAGEAGGLWHSSFKNIQVANFQGDGFYLEGGRDVPYYLLPNQFLTFENIRVTKNNLEQAVNSHSLKLSGQQGQITFLNCSFDGYQEYNTTTDEYKFAWGHNVYIDRYDAPSAVVSFINCTFQSANYGIYIDYGENITIDNCWFENLGVAITVNGLENRPCQSINILNNRFANASGFGVLPVTSFNSTTNPGNCIQVSYAMVNVHNNYTTPFRSAPIGSAWSTFMNILGDGQGVTASGNCFTSEETCRTFGILQSITPLSGVLNIKQNKIVFITSSATTINTIKSRVNAGEIISVKANGGIVTFSASGNIKLANRTTLSLAHGETAQFVKIEDGTGYVNVGYELVALVRSTTP